MDCLPAPLRIALIAAEDWQPLPWQSRLIGRLLRDPRFELTCRIGGERAQPAARASALARAILSLEDRLLGQKKDRALDEGAVLALATLPYRSSAHDPGPGFDLALALTDRCLSASDLRKAALGEWALSFAGLPPGSSPAHAALTVLPRDGLLTIDILERTAQSPSPERRRRARYNPKPLARMTGDFLSEKALILLETQLYTLLMPPQPAHLPEPMAEALAPRSALGYCSQTLRLASRRGVERLRERLGRARHHWQLGAGIGGIDGLAPRRLGRLPRHHHTMADPFLFSWRDALYLFYEATAPDGSPGWIEVALIEDGGMVRLGPALRLETHLSYPFVFAHEGEIYMMPETQQRRRLEVWRATDFPLKWELYATAFDGLYLAESSLFLHRGQWWLFTNLSDHSLYQDHSSELYLFAVDGPRLQQIEPHPMNPVVIGSDVARNAGAIITEGGRLFRPSQMNAHGTYGYGLNLMQIDRLDHQSYSERLYRRFTPKDLPGAAGLHHLSVAAGRHVIDLYHQ